METNVETTNDTSEDITEYKLAFCKCLSKICGCDINSQLTKGFTDSILEYFHITDMVQSINDGHRLNVIHLWGTENRSTTDLETWLSDYKPFEIEWINDFSCNLVFNTITESFVVLENYTVDYESANDSDLVKNKSEECLQTGIWRQVINLPDGTEKMFMRLADKNDVKVKGAGKESRFYAAHGNPRYNNVKGVTSKSLRDKLKRSHSHSGSATEEIGDSRLIAYDDLPVVDKATELSESDDEDEPVDRPDDIDHSPTKRRKMISTMKLYSDRLDERSYGGTVRHIDSKKRSVHSRLG